MKSHSNSLKASKSSIGWAQDVVSCLLADNDLHAAACHCSMTDAHGHTAHGHPQSWHATPSRADANTKGALSTQSSRGPKRTGAGSTPAELVHLHTLRSHTHERTYPQWPPCLPIIAFSQTQAAALAFRKDGQFDVAPSSLEPLVLVLETGTGSPFYTCDIELPSSSPTSKTN